MPTMTGVWRSWLAEDVNYIITDGERQAFKKLKTDEERRLFVEQFWRRRDPTPDTQENEFKEEHYRRIADVDGRFSTMVAGSKTDRGMIYIKYGPPDEIEAHPEGGAYKLPPEQGGEQIVAYPFEVWRYQFIKGVGTGVDIEFVDTLRTGDYHIALDPDEKEDGLYAPGTPSPKLAKSAPRTEGSNGIYRSPGDPNGMVEMSIFEPVPSTKAPVVHYKDLEAALGSGARYRKLPMRVRADYIRMTHATIAADVMVQLRNSDLQYVTTGEIAESHVRVFGRVTDLEGHTVDWFEDTLNQEIMASTLTLAKSRSQVYLKRLLLPPGVYRLSLAAQDSESHSIDTFEMALNVPSYDAGTLGVSSVILADHVERVPATGAGADPFVIRSTRVQPRIDNVFKQSETMGIYAEFYNFGFDVTTRKWTGTAEFEVVHDLDGAVVATDKQDLTDAKEFPQASPFLVMLERKYPLKSLAPGSYTLRIKVEDQLRNQTLTPSAKFTVVGS